MREVCITLPLRTFIKLLDPLFLEMNLKTELIKIEGEKVERKRRFALREFQQKLASLNVFDPACGSGNFLTESYIQVAAS